MSELSNWGRWGADDERGALWFLTEAHRAQAATLVRDGMTVSLVGIADPTWGKVTEAVVKDGTTNPAPAMADTESAKSGKKAA